MLLGRPLSRPRQRGRAPVAMRQIPERIVGETGAPGSSHTGALSGRSARQPDPAGFTG
jgi:hypothetical protein